MSKRERVELHWSERRELERIIDRFGLSQAKVEQARRTIVATSSADEMLSAIIDLVEYQSAHYAWKALRDTSKYPQRIVGCADGLRALLEFDLHLLREDRVGCKPGDRSGD